MIKVYKKIRWEELFPKEASPQTRRKRWEQWKTLASPDTVYYWEDCSETCFACKHNDKSWCTLQSLPCTVNPILTFRYNYIGMACMGMCFENKQLELFQ